MSPILDTNLSIDILNSHSPSLIEDDHSIELSRRNFIKDMGKLLIGAGLISNSDLALAGVDTHFWHRPRELYLYNANTKEYARFIYFKDGQYIPQGIKTACYLLRDHHVNKSVFMDYRLLDLLRAVYGYFQINQIITPLVIHSGFRTVETNNKLSKEGAAKNSMHLYGKAVDFHVPNISLKVLESLGKYYQQGGVGFYPNKNFLHLDTGRVRYWKG